MAILNIIQTTLKVTGLSQFLSAAKQYDRALKGMASTTKKAASDMNVGLKATANNLTLFFDQVFDTITRTGIGYQAEVQAVGELTKAWNELGKNVSVNTDIFNEAITQGKSITEAFDLATGKAQEAANTITILGTKVSRAAIDVGIMTAAIGAITTATRIYVNLLRESINEYTEFIEKVRILRLQLGMTTQETAGWIRALELSGVSITTATRGLTSFTSKYGNLRLRMGEGIDTSNNFTRALNALNIEFEDAEGNLRPMGDVLDDVNQKFQDLGPGILTATLAQDLFGFAGRNLLPVLIDQSTTLKELMGLAEEYGAIIDEKDRKAYEDWRKATIELKLAQTGFFNSMAKEWLPLLGDYAWALAQVVKWLGMLDRDLRGTETGMGKFIPGIGPVIDAFENLRRVIQEARGITEEVASEEEELANAREKQKEVLDNLVESEDALIKKREKIIEQLARLRRDLGSRLLEIQIRNDQQIEDAFLRHWRRIVDIERRWNQRLADARTKFERRLEDIGIRSGQRRRELEFDRLRRIANLEEDFRFKREDLERKHRDKLEDIQTKFLDTVQEAARSNDAVAVVRAIRQRARDTRDAETKRGRDIRDLDIDLGRRRKRINDDAKARADAEKRRFQDELDRARLQYDRQLADLRESLRRQREEAGIAWRRRLDDIEIAFRRQQEATARWYIRQENELLQHFTNMTRISAQELMRMGLTMEQVIRIVVLRVSKAAAEAAARAAGSSIRGGGGGGVGGGTAPGGPCWTPRAEGGIDIVRRPTTFLAGEAGPEIAAFIPLRGSMNINHSFGKLGVDINGAGGMNTGQVESIVFSAMISLAERLANRVVR